MGWVSRMVPHVTAWWNGGVRTCEEFRGSFRRGSRTGLPGQPGKPSGGFPGRPGQGLPGDRRVAFGRAWDEWPGGRQVAFRQAPAKWPGGRLVAFRQARARRPGGPQPAQAKQPGGRAHGIGRGSGSVRDVPLPGPSGWTIAQPRAGSTSCPCRPARIGPRGGVARLPSRLAGRIPSASGPGDRAKGAGGSAGGLRAGRACRCRPEARTRGPYPTPSGCRARGGPASKLIARTDPRPGSGTLRGPTSPGPGPGAPGRTGLPGQHRPRQRRPSRPRGPAGPVDLAGSATARFVSGLAGARDLTVRQGPCAWPVCALGTPVGRGRGCRPPV